MSGRERERSGSARGRDETRDDYGPASAGVKNKVSVLVRNIPLTYTAEDLRAKFETYGELRDVYIPRDYYTQRSRGFGFIEFRDTRDADEAIYRLDRTTLEGREINVSRGSTPVS
ncbi:Serine/arginine-rich splicing factor 12 [Tetrabaena socialis]|uniref:Serine/arginine-rich splicing factor 12 n=1 Tax=Tetrabaena socialis TaxID=47790 RepID=A0A2J7ZL93_9CHLO|nr:Serine/arginine-rich splicing factor 12 [Tetrabaena socialis]|eukprot:PNH01045.1 Serine/arginine-rich splicing factor 12 [Tetrabaena socialis]